MSTFHAVVWMDHEQAHVLMFDREHVESQKIKSRSHHRGHGRGGVDTAFFQAVAAALAGVHEILLTGPAAAKDEFAHWLKSHAHTVAAAVTAVVTSDHPSDAQLVALARKHFERFDRMAADPSRA